METPDLTRVDNDYYHRLGARWYSADDDPIALLRAEARTKNPWVLGKLKAEWGARPLDLLDIGCGAGFLCNDLASGGHQVSGVDASEESLRVARLHDVTGRIDYRLGDAYALPFPDATFDAVCAMDFLEHVEEPARVIAEAARVLKPGGIFFFHTFNRNWLSWLVVIQAVRWLVPNTPTHLHILRLFIKPQELQVMCRSSGLEPVELKGLEPVIFSWAALSLLFRRRVPKNFGFRIVRSTWAGYIGYGRKKPENQLHAS